MKRFDLRLPDELHERLVSLAQRERRSLHAQILRLIEDGLAQAEAALGADDGGRRTAR